MDMLGVQLWVKDLLSNLLHRAKAISSNFKVVVGDSCSQARELGPRYSIGNVGAIGVHVMDCVGVRDVNSCSSESLVVVKDTASVSVCKLFPVRYFVGQVGV